MGKHLEWATEMTEFQPPTRITYTSVEGQISFAVTNVLEPVAGGTRLTYRVDTGSGLRGAFARLAEPFIAIAQTRTLRANPVIPSNPPRASQTTCPLSRPCPTAGPSRTA